MTLDPYRDKWREAPMGSDTDGRIFSTNLLKLTDQALLSQWEYMAARREMGELGWVGPLYRDTFSKRRVLELGSGLGFDGLRFAGLGAHWIFADIVPDNLALIERVGHLKGLSDRIHVHHIDDNLSFSGLGDPVNAVWVFGSIHHVPFEIARKEAMNVLPLMEVGGRWMELVYSRERWLREGSLPFNQWGKLTDGERTPWAEWHDIEKVRDRLAPAQFQTVLDFPFCNFNYRWLDLRLLEFDGQSSSSSTIDLLARSCELLPGTSRGLFSQAITCPKGLFAEAMRIPLEQRSETIIDLDVHVMAGAIGFHLVDALGTRLPGAEFIAEAGLHSRKATLRAADAATIVVSNLHSRYRGQFHLLSLRQR